MPSFNYLLVLAVLALSASVQSAPVGDVPRSDPGYGIVPIEGGLLPAPGVNQGGVVPAPDEGDLVPAPGVDQFTEEGVSVDLGARDFDEDDTGLDEEDIDADEEEEPSTLERRASKKTKAASKPKTTKAPQPKTTKAKTTKVRKTTAKATTTMKPAKTTKAIATFKPAKTAKATSKPAKASKTAKATGTATPSSCPIKKPTKKPRGFAHAHLFERDNEEFIGWHGTNSDTAAFWATKGHIEKPVKADGFLDFLGIGTKVTAGTSGADAEIGPGLYVADNKETGILFANNNVKRNKGTTPALCAVFARSSGNWRNVVRKAFIPENLVGDASDKAKAEALENARIDHVKQAVPGVNAESVVKFALFDRKIKSGQMVIPESIGSQFTAKCFKVEGEAVVASDAAASAVGTQSFPQFSFNGGTLRGEWNIAAENAGGCN
ncbi:hypothetical protein LXA43DRAFT_147172 [Ganoderma leucocontextum]|nr:hypothetical protein LXA43DRAFT_147172 [Ganoderma leucocontextum]